MNILNLLKLWLLTKLLVLLFGCNSPRPHGEEHLFTEAEIEKVTTADIRYVEKSKKIATYPSVSDANLYDIDHIDVEDGPPVIFVIPGEMGNNEKDLWIALGHRVREGVAAFQYEKLHLDNGSYRYQTGVIRDEDGVLRPLQNEQIAVEYIFIWNDRKVAENNIRATGFGLAH